MKKMLKSLMAAIGVALLMTGSVFAATTVTIGDVEALKAFAAAVNSGISYEGDTVTLSADLDLTGVEWTPIGVGTRSSKSYNGNAFKGTFDGGSHTISGLTITSTASADAAVGLFGVVDGGTVKNLKLDAVNINVASSDLAGGAIGLMVNNAKAENITVGGSIVGNDGVGGIVGRLIISGTISSCTNNASVTSSYGGIGGIVGKAYYEDGANTALFASVDKCVNNGTITAPMYVGGIVGLARANVIGCINNGVVVGGTQTGGIVGQLIAAGTVSNNENNAKISGKNHLGGIIGDYSQSNAYTYYNVTIADNINRGELAATEQRAAILGCNNIDGFTAMTASGNVSFYNAEGLELFGNPEDMVIDSTNMFNPAAKIGETIYATFAEALTAAKAMTGDVTVEIYEKVTLNSALSGNYSSITFVGKDTDAEIYLDVQGYITATGKTVNFQDLKLSKSQGGYVANAGFMNLAFGVYDVATVNYTNCTFLNGAYASSGAVTFSNCTFYRSHDRYGLWAYGAQNIVVDGCTFADIRGIKMYDEGKFGTTSITVKNTSFAAVTDKPAIVLTYGNSVTLDNNTYNADKGTFELDLDGNPNGVTVTSDVPPTCINDNGACGVLVDGKIYTTVAQAAAVAISGSTVTLLHDSTETVELPEGVTLNKNNYAAAGVTVAQPVAQIGETTYATLEAAFAAATEGQSITLLQDATPALTSQRAITKAAVIDLGGKTLTLTEDDLYFGTTTFQNGTIVVDPSVKPSTAVFWMFANQTLTFDAVKIVATGVTGTYLIGLDGDNADLNLLNGSEILVENTTALDLDIVCVNASTGNDIVIDNSKINVKNLDGRVLFRGNYAIKGDSEINLEGITKAGIRIEAGQTLSIEDTASVTITGEPRDGGIHLTDATATYTKADTATVTATVNRPAIAQIGDAKYASLAEAVAAAQAGDEIVLLADVAEDVVVPAGVIFNGNGKQVGVITAAGTITFKGVTKATNFGVQYVGTTINIGEGACLEITGTSRLVVGHGCTFNITGTVADAKTADKATLTPSLIVAAGASFTGKDLTFNVKNAYVKFNGNSTSKNKSANGTFNFNIENSIWEQTGVLAFYVPTEGMDPTFNLNLKDSVLTTTSHLVFSVTKGEIVFDNSNINVGKSNQIENRSTMTIKNGSVVNGAVATSSNAINPGTIIVENATYAVTGQFSGAAEGTGTLIIKKGANVSVGSIVDKANIQIDATGMTADEVINFTANLSKFTGTVEVVNNDKLEASVVDGKIVLALKPVAKIGDTPYTTIAAAIAAAQNGDTVVISAGEYAPININYKNITIQGTVGDNGELLTVIKGGNPAITGHSFNGTIKDIKVVDAFKVMYAEPAGNVTVDNIYVTGATYGLHLVACAQGLNWTIKNSYMDLAWANSFGVYGGDAAIVIKGNEFVSTNPYYPDYGAIPVNTFLPNITVEENVFGENTKIKLAAAFTDTSKINVSKNYHADGVENAFADDSSVEVSIRQYYTDSELQNLVELLKGAGTEADPFVIATIEDLKFFRDEVNGGNTFDNQFVKLTADIDLNSVVWTPIGNGTTKFLGTFDGSGKTISNLVVDINANNAGLFGFASVIKNLAINNAKVEGVVCVGAMVGELESSVGTLDNCRVTGRIEVTGENSVGGLAGKGYANIRNSSVIGDGVATSFVLGIYGTTEEGDNIGGLIGHLGEGNTLGVANSTVKNIKVVGTRKIGGLVGTTARANDYVGNTVENVTVESSATAEYADNNALTCTIGGIIGNYFGSATSGGVLKDSTVKDVTFVIGNAKSAGALVGGDRVNNGGEPVGVEASGSVVQNVAGATVSYFLVAQIGDSYYATLQAALDAAAAGTGNVTVEILSDIDLTGTAWNPVTVSASGYPFVTVNGNDKTITGLNDMLFAGTWAGKSGLVINDLTIAESTIVNDENDSEGTVGVGAFIGYPQASETITLKNCHLTKSTVKGGHWTGGLIGMAGGYSGNDGPVFMTLTIDGCSVTDSTITGKGSAGGIIGHGSCSAWTDVIIVNSTVSGNTITSTGSSNNKAGSVMGTIGAAGQPTTADGVTKTGGMSVSVTTADNTVMSANTVITTIYGRQGTPTGLLEIAGGTYEAYPIEENVNYAAPKEGYIIFENADGKYGVKEGTYVAQIDGVKYETLAAAFAAAQDGDVVTFLSDVKQNDGVLITDKKLTVDLNGKTFTVSEGASTNNRNFKINGASEVVISNGTMVAEGDYGSGAYGTVRTEGTAHVALQNLELYNYRGNGLNVKACSGTVVTMTDVKVYAQYGGGIEAAGGMIELIDVDVEQKGMYTAPYNSMAISVNGGGTVTVQSGTYSTECLTAEEANNQGTSHGPWVAGVLNSGGTLIINGGMFSNDNFGENSLATHARGAILADTAANIQINGGTFNALKAIVDIQNNLGNADKNPSCVLAGGTFSADPCVSANYGSNLITVKEGYLCAEQNSNPVTYKVGKLPSAEVVNLGPVTIGPDGDYTFGDNYYVYDLVGTQKMTTSSEPFDLQIALDFIAKDTVAQAEKNAFGNYTTDFYITIDGIKDGEFVADENCYLAGYYPSFNAWVKIPLTGFTIEDGKVYPVITSAGFDFKYTDICGSVGDFICGIHLSDDVLAANPNLNVKLELGLSKTFEEAQSANSFITVDQPYVYDVEDLTKAVAISGPDYFTKVSDAVAAALEMGDYVKLVKNNAGLEDNLEINRDLVFNLGGKTLNAADKTLAIADSVVTITNGTLSAFTKDNITLTGNAVLTVTDANVAASFRLDDTYYVSQNANGTYSIMLKSAFRVFITMVDGEPRIGFFKDCCSGSAPTYTLLGATNLENPEWQAVNYEDASDASDASTLPLYWAKLDQAANDTKVYRFFKIGPAPAAE